MVSGWSLTEIVQMALISCISRSWGQKIGFQNAIFKYFLVWNNKAQSFHFWYIASSRGPLPKLFKLGLGVKIDPALGGQHFTLKYIRKSSNDLFSWTANFCPNSTIMIPGWSPTKIVQMVLMGCISRSQGKKLGFQNAILKNLLVWNYKAQSFHIWCLTLSRGSLPIFGGQY